LVVPHLPGPLELKLPNPHLAVTGALSGLLALLLAFVALAPTPWELGLDPGETDWRGVSVRRWVLAGSWCAAAGNALLTALLLATRRWWLGGEVAAVPALAPPGEKPRPLHVAWVVLAIATLATLSFTRLDQSFWDDEASTVERAINGRYGEGPDGELRFKPASWSETLWYYRSPNNHVPYSIAARLSLAAWQKASGVERHLVSERAVRAPAFLAGLVSIPMLAGLLFRLGFPRAAPASAALLALHPWVLRYASEGRGYAFLLVLVPLSLWLLLRVWHRGTWPRWSAFAAAELAVVWTFPGAFWLVLVASLAAALGVIALHPHHAARRTQLARWSVAHLGAGMVGLQLGLPLVGPLLLYLGGADTKRPVGASWLRNEAGYLFAGAPWTQAGALGPGYVQLTTLAAEHPLLFWGTALAAGLAAAAGAVRLAAGGRTRALLLAVLLLPGALTWIQATLTGSYLFEWYLLFVLPGLAALAAIGWDALPRLAVRRFAAAAVAALFLLAFGFVTQPTRQRLCEASLQPLRESARLVRPDADPFAPSQSAILSASHTVPSRLYDPNVRLLKRTSELRALMQDADANGRALYVDHGWHLAQRRDGGGFWELLQNEKLFEQVAVLPGFKPRLTRFVWRYRGASAP
jgi:hypothetical protein